MSSSNHQAIVETTEQEIRARYAKESRLRREKWEANRQPPPPALNYGAVHSTEESTFTPIHSLSDYTSHVHPAAFAFAILFDVPLWRRTDGVDRVCHSLYQYYTDSSLLGNVLRQHQRKNARSLHELGGKWVAEGGEHDKDGSYFARVSLSRLFHGVEATTANRLKQLWGLARDGSSPTLISLGFVFTLSEDLEAALTRSAVVSITKSFDSKLVMAMASAESKASKRQFLEDGVRNSAAFCVDLVDADKYMTFEEWWSTIGARVRVGGSYTLASKGLLLAWTGMCRVIGHQMNESNLVLMKGEHVLLEQDVAIPRLWELDESSNERRERAISIWRQGALWFDEDAIKLRNSQGEMYLNQWYRDLVVDKCGERITAVQSEISTVAEVHRRETMFGTKSLLDMLTKREAAGSASCTPVEIAAPTPAPKRRKITPSSVEST